MHIGLDYAWLFVLACLPYIDTSPLFQVFFSQLFRVATGQLITEKRDGSENVAYGGVRVGDWFRSTSGYAPLKHDFYRFFLKFSGLIAALR